MSRSVADDIRAGLEQALAIANDTADPAGYRIRVPASVDVRAIRRRLGLTQGQFADRFGFTLAAVRDWEQRRRTPEGAARVFLLVIDREPEAVRRALSPDAVPAAGP
jgi:putative transcriptional regulator